MKEYICALDKLAPLAFGLNEFSPRKANNQDLVDSYIPVPSWRDYAQMLVSYAIGCAFGRWHPDVAEGAEDFLASCDLFGQLPAMPPGATKASDPHQVLVEDSAHPLNIAHLTLKAVDDIYAIYGGLSEEEICRYLARESVSEYISRSFFAFHLTNYSVSMRKAPIYWPLSTLSGNYTIWLYYPALTDQTLFIAANDFVGTKLERQIEPALRALRQKTGRSRAEEQELEALQTFHDELRALREELLRLAPTWKPNHDDGVQITAAPLWRLFRHRPWQAVLKDTWEKLEAGAFDWAHLAMTYWPDRVREKCRADKSLAIAHNLEHLYEPPPEAPAKAAGGRGRKKRS